MAGHSKWANIKHKKGAADAKRSKIFTKVIKELTVAAKIGGGDPDSNPRLRTAVAWAKSENMPKDNIERAIKKGAGGAQGDDYETIIYEGYGPHQVAVIVECLTDNKNRTVSSVRSIFNKNNGNLGASNSVGYMFDRVGIIEIEKSTIDEDTLTEHILEAGAEDIDSSGEEMFEITTAAEELHSVQTYLENQELEIKSAQLDLVPQNTIEIDSADKAKQVFKFIDALEDDDDVQKVYSNFDLAESVAAELEAE